jgi:hypothetical protein
MCIKNIHKAQTQDSFCDGDGKTQTLAAVEACSQHTSYIKKGSRISDSYSVRWKKCMEKKLFSYVTANYIEQLQPFSHLRLAKPTIQYFVHLIQNILKNNAVNFKLGLLFLFQEYTNIF